jgi:hypothetical protein
MHDIMWKVHFPAANGLMIKIFLSELEALLGSWGDE